MSSIAMNPGFAAGRTYTESSELRQGHQLAVLRGVIASLAILSVGAFTMVMPILGPASEMARRALNHGPIASAVPR